MADYWKSNDRKFCDFCKCWITNNKPSIAFHENGRRHKANVAKRISEISRNSAKSEKEKQKMDQEIRKMEEAALKSYAHDISSQADLTARSVNAVLGAGSKTIGAQVDPLMPPEDFDPESEYDSRKVQPKSVDTETTTEDSMWVEAKSPDNHTYYWNVKTNESVWEPPKEGFMPIDEYNRINQIAVSQQQLQLQKESKNFQDNAAEVVARYRREQLKAYRRPDVEQIQKEEKRAAYKTEEDMKGAGPIGEWQVVVEKKVEQVDLELPKQEHYIPQVVSEITPEPPAKRFKEKTIEKLDKDVAEGISGEFKKRKFANKKNARQRLDVD